MLADEEKMNDLEKSLRRSGKIDKFESEYGRITGRMMITRTQIPDGIEVEQIPGKTPQAFEASFDFYDSAAGIAVYTDIKRAATGIWITPQSENACAPSGEWIEFFVDKLMQSINEDGSYGVPIYSFINDDSDMTVIPSK